MPPGTVNLLLPRLSLMSLQKKIAPGHNLTQKKKIFLLSLDLETLSAVDIKSPGLVFLCDS